MWYDWTGFAREDARVENDDFKGQIKILTKINSTASSRKNRQNFLNSGVQWKKNPLKQIDTNYIPFPNASYSNTGLVQSS